MSVFEWIEMAKQLDADGLEMYTGFFTSFEDGYIDCVGGGNSQCQFLYADALLFARFNGARSQQTEA